MNAKTIVENARKSLVDLIVKYLRKYDGFLFTGNKKLSKDGEIYLYDEDFNSDLPTIEIAVDNSYLDVEDNCTEPRRITQFIINEDGDLSFCVVGPDTPELKPKDLTIEELARIANYLQNEYETL